MSTPPSTRFAVLFTRAYAVYHVAMLCLFCALVSRMRHSVAELVGLTISVGLLGGAAFNVAHELIHRRPRIDQRLASVLLCFVGYPSFQIEHVAHHHKWVATEKDPATAPLGSSLYTQLPRAILGNLRNAAHIGYRQSRSLGLRNPMIRLWTLQASIYVAIGLIGGGRALLFLVAQSLIAMSWLEIANYFQHYGLRRRVIDGRLEPVADRHSWNVNQPSLNRVWLNLPWHAQHHASPLVSFDRLGPSADSPQYPVGYLSCTFLALIPPLWHRFTQRIIEAQGERP